MKQVFTIQNTTDRTGLPQKLSIMVGPRHIGYAITDMNGQELYELDWQSGEITDAQQLSSWYEQHPVLQQSFDRIAVGYDFPQSLLIPQAEWKEGTDMKQLLQAAYGNHAREIAVSEQVMDWQINNVYLIRKEVYDYLQQFFPGHHYWHTYTIGIRDIETTGFEGVLGATIRNDDFSLVISKGHKLLLAQNFEYATPADVVYYLLLACRQFGFSQETVKLKLAGLVDRSSALYRELEQYFLHTEFRQPQWQLATASTEYPSHFFTPLNDLARCAS